MTYYEELGVSREATEEEIRKSFRNLSRMIHPDQHQDERLKALAEVQMKRLCSMVDTLSDREKRREYDESLLERPSSLPGEPPVGGKQRESHWSALLAGVVFGCLLMYVLATLLRPTIERPEEGSKAELPAVPKQNPASAPVVRTAARNRSIPPINPEKAIPSAPAVQPPRPLDEPLETALPLASAFPERELLIPPSPPRQEIPTPAVRAGNRMTGTWLYVPKARSESKNGSQREKWDYTAEFVELRVREESGTLEGSYRSRYKIPDKPLQPEVSFRFRGALDSPEIDWEGPGGAKGKIKFEIRGDNTLLARWRATETGSVLSLASGSALLVRMMD